ncbi:DNA-binding response regulator, partial [Clostridiaceae bacterium UIB06]|nr:DNA-binding response regulator [Clostridiaceae bacterium UIB06]
MRYEKAQNILPQDVIELIQQYVDGGYLYIP